MTLRRLNKLTVAWSVTSILFLNPWTVICQMCTAGFANYCSVCIEFQSYPGHTTDLMFLNMDSCIFCNAYNALVLSGVNMVLYQPFVRHHFIHQLYRHVRAQAALESGGRANVGSTVGLDSGTGAIAIVGMNDRAGPGDGGIPARGGDPEGGGLHENSGVVNGVVMDIRNPNFRLYSFLHASIFK